LIAGLVAILLQFERGKEKTNDDEIQTIDHHDRERVAVIFHGMGIEPKHVAIFWREAQKSAVKKITVKRAHKVA
jgi:hypothetical protein